ncbi:hypothetical protein M409DRAFT_57402 [Zasmidium cellare ATCC 36951]|uniref:F-box domain-containing protein n=1 Tax=Zasmidium cellare ATCC 36951 TaxID=1080233 RepID=A0A6A6CBC2_ZASCE|nr:uncharacterized protein M409DRAFT_57402 [Zasmidium cellare ATCC 36951]KAF2163510.1 hypothetical protein M409DRAFT_57402 [Zasmidium cellare ATCC 36951]
MLGVSSLLRAVYSGASPSNFLIADDNKNNHDYSADQTSSSSTPTLNATVTSIMDLLGGNMLNDTNTPSTPPLQPASMPGADHSAAKVASTSSSHTDESPETTSQTPLLFTLPAELRNRIYAFATSYPDKITIKTLQPLTQVSKQLRHEVLPTFHDHNTFILTSPGDLRD